MSKLVKWHSIGQFRQAIKNIQSVVRYAGTDENGDAIFNNNPLPKLTYVGTTKVHGTNSAIGVSYNGDIWYQSRERIITVESDNAGFAMFATARKDLWKYIAELVKSSDDILIYGEFAGKGIQKGVAVSEVDKFFVIFGIVLVDADDNKFYMSRENIQKIIHIVFKDEDRVFSIYDFQQFEVEIDFDNPHLIQNELNKLCEFVEQKCPVGSHFGIEGIGEGIVFSPKDDPWRQDVGLMFKVKGEAHSKSKVKTLANVDVEKLNSLDILANLLANNGRLQQGCQLVFNTLNGGEVDIKKMGDMIKWVMKDIAKEEIDTIAASGFNMKELSSPVGKIVRNFVMKELEL
jgi:hypothetical protein